MEAQARTSRSWGSSASARMPSFHTFLSSRSRRPSAQTSPESLRRMGVQISAWTVQKTLEENGLGLPGGGRTWEAHTSVAKDAVWALDFFAVRTLRGELLQALEPRDPDVHTQPGIFR